MLTRQFNNNYMENFSLLIVYSIFYIQINDLNLHAIALCYLRKTYIS